MMIKGVNKHIVEINNPDNDYFEKVILYIKSEKLASTQSELTKEAKGLITGLMPQKKKMPIGKIVIAVSFITGIGMMVVGIIMLI